jgi:trehalose-6-phosphate synthase
MLLSRSSHAGAAVGDPVVSGVMHLHTTRSQLSRTYEGFFMSILWPRFHKREGEVLPAAGSAWRSTRWGRARCNAHCEAAR